VIFVAFDKDMELEIGLNKHSAERCKMTLAKTLTT
jgi:hypothetical protein